MEENFTLGRLFEAYRLSYLNIKMTEEQSENLRRLQEKRGKLEITLSQIDAWLMQAGLVRKKRLSLTETGMIFSKFKSFSLDENSFTKFIELLSHEKKFDLENVKFKLVTAGLPGTKEPILTSDTSTTTVTSS